MTLAVVLSRTGPVIHRIVSRVDGGRIGSTRTVKPSGHVAAVLAKSITGW